MYVEFPDDVDCLMQEQYVSPRVSLLLEVGGRVVGRGWSLWSLTRSGSESKLKSNLISVFCSASYGN